MTGLLICHKNLAFELVETAQSILGHHDNLYPFSNETDAPAQLLKRIKDFIDSLENPSEIVIMVDLRGGNCWSVSRMLCYSNPEYHLISGVNLPMVLSFLSKRDTLPFEELVRVLAEDAHRGILLDE